MPDNIGFSFAPGADQQTRDQAMPGGGAPRGTSPQQAVKILSLRVPKQLPSNAPVSRELLNGPGGAGAPGLTSMIQQLMQAFRPKTDQFPQSPAPQPMPEQAQPPTLQHPIPSSPGAPPPLFEGNIDTPPMQNAAPPLFDQEGPNPWEVLRMQDDDPLKQHYLDLLRQSGFNGQTNVPLAPTPPPRPIFRVDNPPTGGGSNA